MGGRGADTAVVFVAVAASAGLAAPVQYRVLLLPWDVLGELVFVVSAFVPLVSGRDRDIAESAWPAIREHRIQPFSSCPRPSKDAVDLQPKVRNLHIPASRKTHTHQLRPLADIIIHLWLDHKPRLLPLPL